MMHLKCLLLCSLLGTASMQAAACYTVYDSLDRVVYHAQTSPVDMSRPLHESLPVLFHMVFDTGTDCPAISPVAFTPAPAGPSPLLTDLRTAQDAGLPHTVLADGIALVQPADAGMASGLSIISSVAVAPRRPGRETIITELRDPPVTIVQSGDSFTIGESAKVMGAGPSR